MRKPLFFALLAVVGGSLLLESCIFSTKKGKLSGSWIISTQTTTGEKKDVTIDPNCTVTVITTTNATFNGVIQTSVVTETTTPVGTACVPDTIGIITTRDTSSFYEVEIVFNEDGTYVWTTTVVDESSGDKIEDITEGNWNFGAGIGAVKAKEQLVLSPTKFTHSDTPFGQATTTDIYLFSGVQALVYLITQLDNKTLVLTWVDNTEDNFGNYDRFTYEATLVPA